MRAIFYLTVMLALALCIVPETLAQGQLALASDNSNALSDTYPHITALENAILGQSFPVQPLTERLGRMEKKAFGSASTNPDLSARTDALDDYTDKQLHKKLLQADVDVVSPNYTDDSPSQTQADYPHVTDLEQTILGQTFAGQPLADRLSRMEVKAFGSASANPDLSERTDALETYAEIKLHKQPSTHADSDAATVNPQQGGGLLSKVGQALLGMTGVGGPGMLGMGPGAMMGPGIGGIGLGGGGMGSGMGMGRSRRQAAQQQQEPEPPVVKHQEDPAVYQAAPPDPNARLITKVGWCEVKVFGHTFPNMHLPERLGQLNHELKLEPGKSDIQLMDDIGVMIKAVQSRKQITPVIQP